MRLTLRVLELTIIDLELTESETEPEATPHALGFQVEMSDDRMLDTSDKGR